MSKIFLDRAPEYVVIAGNIPKDHTPTARNEWQITEIIATTGERYRYVDFGCPRDNFSHNKSCTVRLHCDPRDANLHPYWHWDGNTTQPTFTPSINCINNPPQSNGCGWHGYITLGTHRNV